MTLDEQIKCVRREIALRTNVYTKWIASGRMDREQAEYEMECMRAVLLTLTLGYPEARLAGIAECVRRLRDSQDEQLARAGDWLARTLLK